MKYILDFDRVIFNWDAYMAAIKDKSLQDLYVDPAVWDTLRVQDYLFEDALNFLTDIDRSEAVIVSAMSPHMGPKAEEYQRRKLQDSGMDQYVSEVVVMKGDKAPYVKPFVKEGSIFIDDKQEHVESVLQNCPPVKCFQMVRTGGSLESGITNNPDIPVVANFTELSAIMQL